MFQGSITALITPFKNGEIDWTAFDNMIEWQIEKGTHALVPCGTTGESPTITHDEHMAIVQRSVDIVKGRIPIIAGSGSNSTREAIMLSKHAMESGATANLIVTPYYNKPTQAGMYEHFRAINDEVDLPLVIYNIPGRCIVDMNMDTMASLAKLPNIIGVKDATSDLARPLLTRQIIGADFCQLSGDDATTAAFLAQGGVGSISVVSNIAPEQCSKMHNAWVEGDMIVFNEMRDKLSLLARDLFCESNPAPVKYAAKLLGICEDDVRRPLLPASDAARVKVEQALDHAGIKYG